MQSNINKIVFFSLAFLTAIAITNLYKNHQQDKIFKAKGTRFTGEDAIFIIEKGDLNVKFTCTELEKYYSNNDLNLDTKYRLFLKEKCY